MTKIPPTIGSGKGTAAALGVAALASGLALACTGGADHRPGG